MRLTRRLKTAIRCHLIDSGVQHVGLARASTKISFAYKTSAEKTIGAGLK